MLFKHLLENRYFVFHHTDFYDREARSPVWAVGGTFRMRGSGLLIGKPLALPIDLLLATETVKSHFFISRSVLYHTSYICVISHTHTHGSEGPGVPGTWLGHVTLRGPCCGSRVLNRRSELNKTPNSRQLIVFCVIVTSPLCFMFEVGVISLQPYNCPHNLHLSASYFPSLCMSPTWGLGAVGNSLHILSKLSCSCLIDFFLTTTLKKKVWIKFWHAGVGVVPLPLLPWKERSSWRVCAAGPCCVPLSPFLHLSPAAVCVFIPERSMFS